jgi:acetyl-CoA synthetase
MADEALKETPGIEHVVVVRRGYGDIPVHMKAGRDRWYHELMDGAPFACPPEAMDAEDMLYILYTSGTTGKPKGIVHTTGGVSVGAYATTKWVFDLKDDDVYWCTADIGWVTGHSYVVYGPLANGATVVMYEGAPDWPQKDRFWEIIERYGVTIFYTAPTAIRAFMRWGTEWPAARPLVAAPARLGRRADQPRSVDVVPPAHRRRALSGRRHLVADRDRLHPDHPLPGLTSHQARLGDAALPGHHRRRFANHEGQEVRGRRRPARLTKPWPSMLRGIYGDPERYVQQYWSRWGRRHLLHRRRRQARRRRLSTGCSAAWTTC